MFGACYEYLRVPLVNFVLGQVYILFSFLVIFVLSPTYKIWSSDAGVFFILQFFCSRGFFGVTATCISLEV